MLLRLIVIVILQIGCALSVQTLVTNRIAWVTDMREEARNGVDESDMERRLQTDLGLVTNWPARIELVTGESGLPAAVLFLALLFAVMFAFQSALSSRVRQYATWFLIALFVVECSLVIHQMIEIGSLHRLYQSATKGHDSKHNPTFTTEHGAVISIANKLPIHATVRDPNIILVLMIAAFFTLWFRLALPARATRAQGTPPAHLP